MTLTQTILSVILLATSLWFWGKGFWKSIKNRRSREHGKKIIETSHQSFALAILALVLMSFVIAPGRFFSVLFVGGLLLIAVFIGYVVQSKI